MQVYFGQIYVEPGICFPFTHHFQKYLGDRVTSLVSASSAFTKDYGEEWNLVIRISAKGSIQESEIRGPTTFKKDKDIEFTIFLPFDMISGQSDIIESAALHILIATVVALDQMNIDTSQLESSTQIILSDICSQPNIVKV